MYKFLILSLVTLVTGTFVWAEDSKEASKDSPTETKKIEKTEAPETPAGAELRKQLESLFEDSKLVNSSDKAKKQKARGHIDAFMDWDYIAQLCLGAKEWQKQPKRGEFSRLLHQVVAKTAYGRIDKFWKEGTTYKFEPMDIKGNEAHVVVDYVVDNSPFKLDYYLHKKQGKWMLYDLAYENERYSENIHEQLDAFLKENPFSKLLEKLNKRLQELDTKK